MSTSPAALAVKRAKTPRLPAADLKFQPEELEALIGKNREGTGSWITPSPEQAKKVVLQFLRSF